MNHRHMPYLTVIRHPAGWTSDQVADLLHHAAGLDHPTLRLKLRQKPPMVLWQVDPQPADLAIRALRQNGGDGMAISLAALEQLGPADRVRDLAINSGRIVLSTVHSGDVAIDPAEIRVLIRATITRSEVRSRSETMISDAVDNRMLTSPIGGIWRVGQRPGMGMGSTGSAGPERRITTSDKLDIHLRDQRIFHIDGDRFAYLALGDLKGHSDKQNMDRMRDLLAHLAPQAIVDESFSLWRPPAGHHRLRLPRTGAGDDPSFTFYSRWNALVYRHVSVAETE